MTEPGPGRYGWLSVGHQAEFDRTLALARDHLAAMMAIYAQTLTAAPDYDPLACLAVMREAFREQDKEVLAWLVVAAIQQLVPPPACEGSVGDVL